MNNVRTLEETRELLYAIGPWKLSGWRSDLNGILFFLLGPTNSQRKEIFFPVFTIGFSWQSLLLVCQYR